MHSVSPPFLWAWFYHWGIEGARHRREQLIIYLDFMLSSDPRPWFHLPDCSLAFPSLLSHRIALFIS